MQNYKTKKRREYFRYCQMCGKKHNQKDMVRVYETPGINWVCQDCYDREYGILYEIDEF